MQSTNAPEKVPAAPAPGPTRRGAIAWLGGGLLAALAAELAWMAGSFLRPRARLDGEGGSVVEAGPVDRFAKGSVTPFPSGRFYLARLEDGGFLALDRTCTHLGCTLPWDEERSCFRCPCHASTFDITGAVLTPPAVRPLDLYRVRIENGIVRVDTSRRQRRQAFSSEQVARS